MEQSDEPPSHLDGDDFLQLLLQIAFLEFAEAGLFPSTGEQRLLRNEKLIWIWGVLHGVYCKLFEAEHAILVEPIMSEKERIHVAAQAHQLRIRTSRVNRVFRCSRCRPRCQSSE